MLFTFHLHISTFWNAQLPEEKEALLVTEEYQEQMSESTFLFLTLDLPTAPLYKDEKEQLIIPQVPLFNILAKFNGNTEKVYDHSHAKLKDLIINSINVPMKVVLLMGMYLASIMQNITIHLAFLQEYKTYKENFLKRFQLTKLPPYLVFCIKRFTKNNFFVEKNPTIVNFPITYVLFTYLKNKYG